MELVTPSGFFPWHLAFGVLLLFKNFNGKFSYNKTKLIQHQRMFMLSGKV
jgi:hypothetical protein